MIGKVGKSRAGVKSAGKSQFGDLVNYIAREADGKTASRCPPFPAVNWPHGRQCRGGW